MSYLRYLYLLAYSGVLHISCCVFLSGYFRLVFCVPNVASFSGLSILDCPFNVASFSGLSILDCPFGTL